MVKVICGKNTTIGKQQATYEMNSGKRNKLSIFASEGPICFILFAVHFYS